MSKPVKKAKKSTRVKAVVSGAKSFPSYWGFTKQVFVRLKQSKSIFIRLIAAITVFVIVLTVTDQQAVYIEQATGVQSVSNEVSAGPLSVLLQTGVLFLTLITGTLTADLTESQQLVLGFVYLLVWLVVIWLLRQILLDKQVSLRDGLYSAGAPLLSTILITLVAAVQLIPLALLAALLSGVATTGAVNGILIAIGFLLVIAMAVVTLYWLVGTLFAAIIVTIYGTYPFAALKSARKIVIGHRVRILKRLLWLMLVNVTVYIALLIPIVFLDVLSGYALSWITVISNILVGLILFIFSASYVYLLYRRTIDEHTV